MTFRTGTVLFCAPADDAAVEEARNYARQHKLTFDDVQIVKTATSVLVRCKKPVELPAP